jgi:hypothetical protein
VRAARRHLDSLIAHGASSAESPLLEARARQLAARSERETLASCLENIVEAARECVVDPATHLNLDHQSVLDAWHDIAHLIGLLRGPQKMSVRALALTRLLVDDPHGLLSRPHNAQELQHKIGEIMRTI